MTPEQEQALIAVTAAGLEDALQAVYSDMVAKIQAGTPPREAVEAAMESFTGTMAQSMSAAFSAILETSIGTAAVLAMEVGTVALSRKLYMEGTAVGDVVTGIVNRHASGWQDARRLALSLFEGYAFRPADAEPLQFNTRNEKLPQYLREALLPDANVRDDLAKAFARIQVDGLKTPALRAAYSELLDAIDNIEAKNGAKLLQKRLDVAFFERMRYFATRIAQTELHRAYALKLAADLMLDTDVEFVQIRRTPPAETCICSLYAGRDVYGLGAGVYPKLLCPVPPYHPFCRCRMVPRPGLMGKTATEPDEGADRYFLSRLKAPMAARVMGSKAKADAVLSGTPADTVYNAAIIPQYKVRTVGDVTLATRT